jgi:hypothetical protein
MMYFTCFWYRDFGCCCCGGSCLGCVAIIFHLVFWLVHFVITVVMVAIGVAYKYAKHTLKVKAPLMGDPSLEEIIEHIRKFFQPLYEIAIQPLEAPMVLFWHASIVILAFCLLIELYGCCVCVCRPYRESQKVNEAIHDGKEKNAKTV